jgi:hypothetical protein
MEVLVFFVVQSSSGSACFRFMLSLFVAVEKPLKSSVGNLFFSRFFGRPRVKESVHVLMILRIIVKNL